VLERVIRRVIGPYNIQRLPGVENRSSGGDDSATINVHRGCDREPNVNIYDRPVCIYIYNVRDCYLTSSWCARDGENINSNNSVILA